MKKYLILVMMILAIASCKRKENVERMMVTLPVKTMQVKAPPRANVVGYAAPKAKADITLSENNIDAKEYAVVENAPAPGTPTATIIKDTSKKIIKQGDISFEAKDIAATRKALLNTLNKLGGYADEDNESVNSDDSRKEYNIKARIPARNFDTFLEAVSSGAEKIDSKHISISDVTTQYIDMTTRLHNQKILETTYLNLLKRASKMSDVLEVEDKLTDTRTEIESEQGQLNYLNKQIAYSSLEITFYTKQVQHDTGNTAGYKFTTSFSDGWQIFQGIFFGLITLWPFVLLFGGAAIVFRNWRKRRRLRTESL